MGTQLATFTGASKVVEPGKTIGGRIDHGDVTNHGSIAYAISQLDAAGGGTLFLNPGAYYSDQPIVIPTNANKIVFQGAGQQKTLIHMDQDSHQHGITGNDVTEIGFYDLQLLGYDDTPLNSSTSRVIYLTGTLEKIHLFRCYIRGLYGTFYIPSGGIDFFHIQDCQFAPEGSSLTQAIAIDIDTDIDDLIIKDCSHFGINYDSFCRLSGGPDEFVITGNIMHGRLVANMNETVFIDGARFGVFSNNFIYATDYVTSPWNDSVLVFDNSQAVSCVNNRIYGGISSIVSTNGNNNLFAGNMLYGYDGTGWVININDSDSDIIGNHIYQGTNGIQCLGTGCAVAGNHVHLTVGTHYNIGGGNFSSGNVST